jgi:phage shock protein A
MGFLEAMLRLLAWVALLFALLVLALGPRRVAHWLRQFWNWLWVKRLEPDAILSQVVKQHEKHIAALRAALARSETAERDIVRNLSKSDENIKNLEDEAESRVDSSDDLGAKAALYKLNLERAAVEKFQEQLEHQRQQITDARRRLHLSELQLRQYEVGRSILLSQLAEAQTVEQQYAIAKDFDPFSAVAEWRQAEGMVHEKAISARAVEEVYKDVAEIPVAGLPTPVDNAALDAQLAELKSHHSAHETGKTNKKNNERNARES